MEHGQNEQPKFFYITRWKGTFEIKKKYGKPCRMKGREKHKRERKRKRYKYEKE